MKAIICKILLVAFFFCLPFIFGVPSTYAATPLDKYHGATLVPRNSTDPSSEQWKQTLRDMRANNVNMVTYVLLYRQTDIHSTQIYTSSNNPTDASLIDGINYAHALGLRVQLKPHIDNDDVPQYWRGEINPTDKDTWFRNYDAVLQHITDIAIQTNAEEICVGTELFNMTSTPGNTPYWNNLISHIRARYNGVLTYSAMFIYEIDDIGFWPSLDYIGISGYWQLSTVNNPTVGELLNSWNNINNSVLQPLSSKYGKPIVLTETGYRSWDCTTVYPWGSPYCGTGVNLNDQANAYEALLAFWNNQPNLKGVVIWGWEPDPNYGGPTDNNFSPQHKPALDVLKKWYGGSGVFTPPSSSSDDVFTDSLQRDWTNWSWDANLTIEDSPNSVGEKVLKLITTKPWAGLRLNSFAGEQTANFNRLNFSVFTTSSDQQYGIWLIDSAGQSVNPVLSLSNYVVSDSNGWKNYSIPLTDLKADNRIIKDIVIQDLSGRTNSVTYFDKVQFQGNPAPSPTPTPSVTPIPSPSPSPSFTPAPGSSITANPNPCFVPSGSNNCTETLSWSVANPQGVVQVRVRETNGLFAQAPYGSQNAPWVSKTPVHMDLYDGNTLLNSVTIVGTDRKGVITANLNPCVINAGSNTCTETISWSVSNPQGVVQVRVRETNGLFAQAPYGSNQAPWVNANPLHMDLYEDNNLLDTVIIQGLSSASPSPSPSVAPVSSTIYDDTLSSGWVNWSWDSVVDFASSIFYKGATAISFKTTAAWGGLHFHSDSGIDTTSYTHLEFAAKADANNKSYGVMLIDRDNKQIGQSLSLANYGGSPLSDSFKLYDIPLTDFGPKGIVKGVIIQDWSGQTNSLINVDEVKFVTK